jgi:hypothetical protein
MWTTCSFSFLIYSNVSGSCNNLDDFINENWGAIPFIKREEEETNMMETKTFEGLRNIRQLKI